MLKKLFAVIVAAAAVMGANAQKAEVQVSYGN